VLARILDDSDFDEFKPGLATALVAGWGELHGYPIAAIAAPCRSYTAVEAQKVVHFLHLANTTATPVLFLLHTGAPTDKKTADKKAADEPDPRHDAPMAHAIARSTVPHLVLTVGEVNAERSDEPRFRFSWPSAETSRADDGVIDPRDTRTVLGLCLSAVHSAAVEGAGHVGVFRS
jgi:acetyl-CoA carboxylase carboxyltransferase component